MDTFSKEFYLVVEAESAMVKLESLDYFQRSGEPVDVYVNRFRALVKKAKLGDKGAIVIKFQCGLNKSLHTTLSDSPACHPFPMWMTGLQPSLLDYSIIAYAL